MSQSKTAVLLINIGTPEKPTPFNVYKFLAHFLSDPRVIDLPKILWRSLLYFIILPIRVFRVTKLYKKIWTDEGSPLNLYMKRLTNALNVKLKTNINTIHTHPIQVYYAMTYSTPKLSLIINKLLSEKISKLIVLPLFPQYSSTTTAAAWDVIANALKDYRHLPSVHFINEYANDIGYQKALCDSITEFWIQHGRSERLLFSFHGIPKRYESEGDPYRMRCESLMQSIVRMLKLPENSYEISYQSRFGWNEWLKPSTQDLLLEWARRGIKSVDIVCPSFSVECLETLEEINIQMREVFLNAGGQNFKYIPALNDNPSHVNALKALIEKFF